ncbi:nuclear transport factor 2 family protein [Nocardioides sp. T2.26MG-1]|uniref:nuclear transport factor 2 family protein n=1 Tax=Nocardioides sp. T2.26MG-1 TaxID=3041166 RepID=UPI0024772EED|nr:nuclear transport factor 2 family protein [Nocardioides sp. T2.26MG-1]CAI9409779.1 hypothetical protein HIDPHFAB_01355 [Nocardioides sp. T2.26MG-1]
MVTSSVGPEQVNKPVVSRFCDHLTCGDIDAVLELMDEALVYWILGEPGIVPAAGVHDKASIERVFRAMYRRLPDGMTFEARSMIAEGRSVALEAESSGTLDNGRAYHNRYHIRFELEAAKIVGVREYHDTQHVCAVWGP